MSVLADDARLGQLLGGRYRIVRLIGRGGMGAVYEATQEDLRRSVALKMMHPAVARDPKLVERFRTEAQAAAAIGHPNITQVFDFSALPPDPPFIVMELLTGISFRDLIAKHVRLDAARVSFIGAQVLSALAAAHARGIIHRDVKPANVFICTGSSVLDLAKVLDFGVAKLQDTDGAESTHGAVVGTIDYMAPEQARGERLDGRADVYAVGAMLYHALTGRKPFASTSIAGLVRAILFESPPLLRDVRPDLPIAFARIVERAMEKDAALRFASATEMQTALTDLAAGTRDAIEPAVSTLPAPDTERDEPRTGSAVIVPPLQETTEKQYRVPPKTAPMAVSGNENAVNHAGSAIAENVNRPGIAQAPKPARPSRHPLRWIAIVAGLMTLSLCAYFYAWSRFAMTTSLPPMLGAAGFDRHAALDRMRIFSSNIGVADVDGDGVEDLIAGSVEYATMKTHLIVYSGKNLEPIIFGAEALANGRILVAAGGAVLYMESGARAILIIDLKTLSTREDLPMLTNFSAFPSRSSKNIACIETAGKTLAVDPSQTPTAVTLATPTICARPIEFMGRPPPKTDHRLAVDGDIGVAYSLVDERNDALLGLNRSTHAVLWRTPLPNDTLAVELPEIQGGVMYLARGENYVGVPHAIDAYDVTTGQLRFEIPLGPADVILGTKDRVYTHITRSSTEESGDTIQVFDAHTGASIGIVNGDLPIPEPRK